MAHLKLNCHVYSDLLPDDTNWADSVEKSEAVYETLLDRKQEMKNKQYADKRARAP